jgi:hypothetical protein
MTVNPDSVARNRQMMSKVKSLREKYLNIEVDGGLVLRRSMQLPRLEQGSWRLVPSLALDDRCSKIPLGWCVEKHAVQGLVLEIR